MFSTLKVSPGTLKSGLLSPTLPFTPNFTCDIAGVLSIETKINIATVVIILFVFILVCFGNTSFYFNMSEITLITLYLNKDD